MKAFLLIYLLLFITNASGQNSPVFPDSNAIWRNYSWLTGHSPGHTETQINDYEYMLDGDTVLVNHYSKLYSKGWRHNLNSSFSSQTHDSVFYCQYDGAIRTDSLKHVYWLSKYDSLERLLYDFNLSSGDTLPLTYSYPTYQININIVRSTDSLLIGNQYKKRFNICTTVDTSVVFSLIEGVGSTNGLFSTMILQQGIEHGENLICFYLNGILSYSTNNTSYSPTQQICKLFTCINPSERISIFPNPANSYLNIKLQDYVLNENVVATIFDETGRLLIQEKMTEQVLRINISGLSSGFYIIQLADQSNIIFQSRFIKI